MHVCVCDPVSIERRQHPSPTHQPTHFPNQTDEAHAASSALGLSKQTAQALAWMDEAAMAACGVTTGAVFGWLLGFVCVRLCWFVGDGGWVCGVDPFPYHRSEFPNTTTTHEPKNLILQASRRYCRPSRPGRGTRSRRRRRSLNRKRQRPAAVEGRGARRRRVMGAVPRAAGSGGGRGDFDWLGGYRVD